MYPVITRLLRTGVGLLCSATITFAATTPPKLTHSVSPVHPEELMAKGVNGTAKLSFRITTEGKVTDAEVMEATDPAFGEAAKAAVAQWVFDPAVRDGQPVAIKVSQEFKFDIPVEKKLELLVGHPVVAEIEGELVDAKSLEEEPKPIQPIVAIYPKSLAGSGKKGMVRLKFVVTKEGMPVNPEIVSSEGDPAFRSLAIVCALKSTWNPILKDGKPVNVAISMPIRFKESAPAGRRSQSRGGGGGDGGGLGGGGGGDDGGGDGF
ncbi:MAG: TonB family protein [Opitutaceae bacterium]